MNDMRVHQIFPHVNIMYGDEIEWYLNKMLHDLMDDLHWKAKVDSFKKERCTIRMNRAMYNRFLSQCQVFFCPSGLKFQGIKVECDERLVPTEEGQIHIDYKVEEKEMGPDGWTGNFSFELIDLRHRTPKIKKVIFHNPATIVFWDDNTKTVVKAQEGDGWDSEKGLAMAIVKKTMGLKEFYNQYIRAEGDI